MLEMKQLGLKHIVESFHSYLLPILTPSLPHPFFPLLFPILNPPLHVHYFYIIEINPICLVCL